MHMFVSRSEVFTLCHKMIAQIYAIYLSYLHTAVKHITECGRKKRFFDKSSPCKGDSSTSIQ